MIVYSLYSTQFAPAKCIFQAFLPNMDSFLKYIREYFFKYGLNFPIQTLPQPVLLAKAENSLSFVCLK